MAATVRTPESSQKCAATGKDPLRVLLTDTIKYGGGPTTNIAPKNEWQGYLQLRGLIDKLISLQRGDLNQKEDRPKDFSAFNSWLRDEGVATALVELQDLGYYGNGVVATQPVQKGQPVVHIPVHMMMTTETALSNDNLATLSKDPILRAVPSTFLALHLLQESLDTKSFWAPYISLLPRSFNTPLFYTVTECEELKGSHVMWETIRYFRSISRQYVHIHGLLERQKDSAAIPVSAFTYEAFTWAISVVMTRQNRVPLKRNNKETSMALVPVWDFCNHEELGEISTFFDPTTQTLECLAGRTFKPGEQITIHYGDRTNADLLLYSGFVDPAAYQRDRVKVAVSVCNSSSTERRKQLCDEYKIPCTGTLDLAYPPLLPDCHRLLLAIRILTCPDAELDLMLALARRIGNNDPLRGWESGIPSDEEKSVLNWLKIRCLVMLRGYKTTVKEDEQLLESLPVAEAGRLRSAVVLRIGEKKLLNEVILYIERRNESQKFPDLGAVLTSAAVSVNCDAGERATVKPGEADAIIPPVSEG